MMKKSFMERMFPQPPDPRPPRPLHGEIPSRSSSRTSFSPPRIILNELESPKAKKAAARSSSSARNSDTGISSASSLRDKPGLQSTPLSASVLHHDDPFLPVERAARALQDTIQSLLDAQSRALNNRVNGTEQDDGSSIGSITPTQSIITPGSSAPRTIPVRQPVKSRITLHGARKKLTRRIQEFAELRGQELQILDAETASRTVALERVQDLERRREVCTTEIESIRKEDTSTTASNLRSEAKNVMSEIEELEHKVLELRVRHRHLLEQADQIDSSLESKVSSFQGSLAMINRETRDFLRRPPVSHSLGGLANSGDMGMYALKADRRTLDMAKEQWTSEKAMLAQRKTEVEKEQAALLEGGRMWSEVVRRIELFEQNLRKHTSSLTASSASQEDSAKSSMTEILQSLDAVIESLEADLSLSESNDWNLMICAIGAELEAFHQAHEMLQQTQGMADGSPSKTNGSATLPSQAGPSSRGSLLHEQTSPNGSPVSNQSLKDTLNEFSDNHDTQKPAQTRPTATTVSKYESEDDEPPADFLLSH